MQDARSSPLPGYEDMVIDRRSSPFGNPLLAEPPPPVSSWLPGLLDASHRLPMPPPRQPAGLPLTDAIETFTSRVLRSGNDAEALGTHSTSVWQRRWRWRESVCRSAQCRRRPVTSARAATLARAVSPSALPRSRQLSVRGVRRASEARPSF